MWINSVLSKSSWLELIWMLIIVDWDFEKGREVFLVNLSWISHWIKIT